MIEGIEVLLSWEILATAIAVYALVSVVKRIGIIYKIKHELFKIFIIILPVVVGGLIGLVPDFLPGNNLTANVVAGIVAGFLSTYFYQFVRRIMKDKK